MAKGKGSAVVALKSLYSVEELDENKENLGGFYANNAAAAFYDISNPIILGFGDWFVNVAWGHNIGPNVQTKTVQTKMFALEDERLRWRLVQFA